MVLNSIIISTIADKYFIIGFILKCMYRYVYMDLKHNKMLNILKLDVHCTRVVHCFLLSLSAS